MKTPLILDQTQLQPFADALHDALPHGSGINCTWKISPDTHGNIVAENSFHCMNESGMYDGYVDFKVTFFQIKKDVLNPLRGPSEGKTQVLNRRGDWDCRISFCGSRSRYVADLRVYLFETIEYSVSEAKVFPSFGIRSWETVNA